MAGPLVHAFEADLTKLDQFDAYAAFAGWQAEHPDIYEVPHESWNVAQRICPRPTSTKHKRIPQPG